jgi:hypothetical protein
VVGAGAGVNATATLPLAVAPFGLADAPAIAAALGAPPAIEIVALPSIAAVMDGNGSRVLAPAAGAGLVDFTSPALAAGGAAPAPPLGLAIALPTPPRLVRVRATLEPSGSGAFILLPPVEADGAIGVRVLGTGGAAAPAEGAAGGRTYALLLALDAAAAAAVTSAAGGTSLVFEARTKEAAVAARLAAGAPLPAGLEPIAVRAARAGVPAPPALAAEAAAPLARPAARTLALAACSAVRLALGERAPRCDAPRMHADGSVRAGAVTVRLLSGAPPAPASLASATPWRLPFNVSATVSAVLALDASIAGAVELAAVP